jgi:hypothetical protein
MTDDEKLKLSLNIRNKLFRGQRIGVLHIIESLEPTFRQKNPDDHIIDLGTLKMSTLRKLQTFVEWSLKKTEMSRPQPSPAMGPATGKHFQNRFKT